MPDIDVRVETPADHARVDQIQEDAFGRPGEAQLVRVLRREANPQISLVAELGGTVVGHVFFSPVAIDGKGPPSGGLAPLAVSPDAQRRGVGAALVRAGLASCRDAGWDAIFLLGDPGYYSRFGFVLAAPLGLRYESEFFDSAFQVLELTPGALSGGSGWVRYHEAFASV